MITLYGIKNCSTVQKARHWLEQHDLDNRFHDFRTDGMEQVPLAQWLKAFGWEQVLNRRSSTWRSLSDSEKSTMDNTSALAIANAAPTLIKRPVTVSDNLILFGFKAELYAQLLEKESHS
ncbi:MAG: ArsC family reductase [Gammaproteobacteria bacterium]|nr:ArsC family reductase [Gammaproteobacteria bacterium]